MVEIRTESGKWSEVRGIINTWLKDPTLYCGTCDSDYYPNHPACCEDPLIGDNWKFCKDIIEAIKDKKKNLKNEYAANNKLTFRSSLSLPSRLLFILEKHFKNKGVKLFENQKELRQFMRYFPQFRCPIKV